MNDRQLNLAVVATLAVILIPILFFGLKQCAQGCPEGQVLARGVFGFVCVQGGAQ
ncbi:hypothetical protein B1VFA_151 [Rhizobium phage B1VFA]|nr:hypothetical protein B1VFA_151 [Rhizobium phage B1VFA]